MTKVRRISFSILCGCLLLSASVALFPSSEHSLKPVSKASPDKGSARLANDYGQLPLSFEANQGQTDPSVKFLSRGSGYTLFLTGHGSAVLSLRRAQKKSSGSSPQSSVRTDVSYARAGIILHRARRSLHHKSRETTGGVVVRMNLVGANPVPQVSGLEELPEKSNYFIGNDPAKWRTNIPHYAKVCYHDVYSGIDLVYHGSPASPRQLEYDFIVAPGADPRAIMLGFQGLDAASRSRRTAPLQIDAAGDLVLHTDGGEVLLRKPLVYQMVNGIRREISGGYVLKGAQQVSFQAGDYDASRPLVIDPVLVYSSYLGGFPPDFSNAIAVDSSGNAYVTGDTLVTSTGPNVAFVAKVAAAGDHLVYFTFLGGSGSVDRGVGIAVDSSGNAYVTGSTNSSNFPTVNPFQSAFGGVSDVFVTKLAPAGDALVYSTYLGGNDFDHARGIAVDSAGNAYVTGAARSTNFPTLSPFQGVNAGGGFDAFVTKLAPAGNALVYSTYLGGSDFDWATGIAVDSSGNAYVTGAAKSTNFPTLSSFQGVNAGGFDAFVTKLAAAGNTLVYSTYLGGSGSDTGAGIAVDSSGNAYVTGSTESPNFPTVNPFQSAQASGFADVFVTKLAPAGSALLYSTYLGGSTREVGNGIAVDSSGNAYVTGSTDSTNFPTVNPFQSAFGGGLEDAFVAKIAGGGSRAVYSSYLGGTRGDTGNGIAVDSSGNAYVTGKTVSTNFPLVNAFSGGNAFVSKISSGYEIVSHQLFIPASSSANVNVACSSGNKVLGGGFEIESPEFVRVFSSEPTNGSSTLSNHQWNVVAQNTDPANAQPVTVSAACAPATLLLGHEIVTQKIMIPASSSANVNVTCSSGNKVLGGGFEIETPMFVHLFSSEPFDGASDTFSDHQWNVFAQNTDPANVRQVTVIATCAPASQLAGHEIVTQQTFIPGSSSANVNVTCSSGNKVLGGGFDIETPDFIRVFSTEPTNGLSTFSERQWNVFAQNTDTGAEQTTVSAVCSQF